MSFDLTYLALWGLVIFQSLVLLGLVRESAETRRKLADLSAGGAPSGRLEFGTKAPSFTAVEARSGRTVRHTDLAGRRSVLLFLSPNCRNCEQLAAGIHGIYHKAEGHLYLICQSSREECLAFLEAQNVRMDLPLLLDPEREIGSRFRIFGVPAAVMLDDELRIRSYGSPRGSEDLAGMVAEAATEGNGTGSSAPEVPAAAAAAGR